jgi:hypothetical protein
MRKKANGGEALRLAVGVEGSGSWPKDKGSRPVASSCASAHEEECTGGATHNETRARPIPPPPPPNRWADGEHFPLRMPYNAPFVNQIKKIPRIKK